MSILIAIVGLGFLVMIHEAGHFFTARAVGMKPRRFYVGFPPALVKTTRNGIEYGLGAIPLGGYVKIPGMHRPAPSDLDNYFGPALLQNPSLVGPVERLKRLVAQGDFAAARAALGSLDEALEQAKLPPVVARGARRGREELADALAHPTWNMGPKITVDSATLANKGLELIEAHFLFGIDYDRIEVVIHPTSTVHALVRFRDGAALAHLGYPDMRVPISFALTYPERAATPVPQLDLASGLTLEFDAPDLEAFPLLGLARRAGEQGGTYPCAFNAANEVGVAAFLEGRLPFLGVAETVEETLAAVDGGPARDPNELFEADAEARRLAERTAAAA